MRNSDRKPLEAAEKKFTANKSYRMTVVKFQTATPQEYIHTPQMFVVNLSTTKWHPLMSRTEGQIIQPQPRMTLSEIKELTQNQRFDVTALVEEVEEPRPTKNDRMRRNIKLIDQSGSDTIVYETKFSLFLDTNPGPNGSVMIDRLRNAEGEAQPLTFIGLSGR